MRFFLLAKICRQQNTASSGQIYAGLRAPQTPRARLAAWTASQNYVLLFFQQMFADTLLPASAGSKLSLYIFPYRAYNILSVSGLNSGLTGQPHSSLQSKSQPSGSQHHSIFRQSLQKPICKNNSKRINKKRKPKLP